MDSKLVLGVIIMITLGMSFILTSQNGYSVTRNYNGGSQSAAVGANEYVAWFSNKSGNWEVMFRSSTDGGQTFSDKINLSNTTETDSVDVEISADGENVIVTWWEGEKQTQHLMNLLVGRAPMEDGPLMIWFVYLLMVLSVMWRERDSSKKWKKNIYPCINTSTAPTIPVS
jgi:uncharacterized protein (UPF0333 family)